ncbi:MAG: GNAT family N-acetyltransferase [Nitrospira sp.]
MSPIIVETARLVFRRLEPTDRDAVRDLLSDSAVMRFVGPRKAWSFEEGDDWFDTLLTSQDKTPTRFVVALKSTNELIGFCGVKAHNGLYDFGYYFRRAYWGKGYATEACRAILPLMHEQYGDRLDIFIAESNIQSLKLAQRVGLVRDWVEVRNGEVAATYRWQGMKENSQHISPREVPSQPPGTPVISIIGRKKSGES